MSRIGLKPIKIPDGVDFSINGQTVTVKGSKGSLSMVFPVCVKINQEDGVVKVTVARPEVKDEKALWGTFRAHLQNMINGVSVGFTRSLEVNGVGYRANVSGKNITLEVGYSHDVIFPIPEGVAAAVEKNIITLSGIDKQLVGETAARIRRVRPPEPYKGTGIKFTDEIVRRKAGKAGKAGAA